MPIRRPPPRSKPREVPQIPPGTRGLRRHPALVELSRDHHHVLVQALALRRAADVDGDRRRVAAEALPFVSDEIGPHTAEEEEVLLPRSAHLDPEGAQRIRDEHREIEQWASRIAGALTTGGELAEPMRELGRLLDDHVRFEERSYFETVQRGLDEEALEELRVAMESKRVERPGRSCTARRR